MILLSKTCRFKYVTLNFVFNEFCFELQLSALKYILGDSGFQAHVQVCLLPVSIHSRALL